VFDLDETLIKASFNRSKMHNQEYDEKISVPLGNGIERIVSILFISQSSSCMYHSGLI
jgi:hypothetical protein